MTETFTTDGTWTVPAGVTSVDIECWGSGASGYQGELDAGGGGGGGGAYAKTLNYAVTPGNAHPYICNPNNDAEIREPLPSVTPIVLAQKGSIGSGTTGGTGGQAAGSTGDTTFNGGSGGNGDGTGGGGGGGSSAGTAGDGNSGDAGLLGIGGTGGAAPTGGVAGSDGGDTGETGQDAISDGGGAGGGGSEGFLGGNYSNGKIVLTYTAADTQGIGCGLSLLGV